MAEYLATCFQNSPAHSGSLAFLRQRSYWQKFHWQLYKSWKKEPKRDVCSCNRKLSRNEGCNKTYLETDCLAPAPLSDCCWHHKDSSDTYEAAEMPQLTSLGIRVTQHILGATLTLQCGTAIMQQLLGELRPSGAGAETSETMEDSWEQKMWQPPQGKGLKSKPWGCAEQDFQTELLTSQIKNPIKFVGETDDRSAECARIKANRTQHKNHYQRRACTIHSSFSPVFSIWNYQDL